MDREPLIIPKPVSLTVREGAFTLGPDTAIVTDRTAASAGRQLAGLLRPATGYALKVKEGASPGNDCILLQIDEKLEALGEEGYRMQISPKLVLVRARRPAGLFYAFQTLRQLFPPQIFRQAKAGGVDWTLPCVRIEDYPRFPWRGAMLDVCRHFMPREFLKKFIDLLALHKMNRFHIHLTDDQGWRIEIEKYPKLTGVGAWRKETVAGHMSRKPVAYDGKPHGGYYTREDLRELVAYARERHITIVPEIEMPGHAQAAIAAYPELGNTGEPLPVRTLWGVNKHIFNAEEETILFLQDVLAEVLEIFPGDFIHVGGDEAVKDQWKAGDRAQERIRELGLKDEHELQSWFIGRMDEFLNARGRRLIGWDEILEGGLAENATVMSWRGDEGGITAARAGHDVVMAPTHSTYFDYYQSENRENEPLAIGGFLPLEKVYQYDPVPGELNEKEAGHILGTQGQIWTEYIQDPKQAEYMAFPRVAALSEVAWSPKEGKDYGEFIRRLKEHLERLEVLDVRFRPLDEN